MIKDKISKILNVPKLIGILWTILWITLFLFLIAKWCLNIWYPIIINNKFIIDLCNFIDSNKLLSMIIMLIFYLINSYVLFMTNIKKIISNNKLFVIPILLVFTGIFFVKSYDNNFGMILEIIFGIGVPIIINIKNKTFDSIWKNILFPIMINLIVIIWQLNIYFIRGIDKILNDMPSLIYIFIQIDYYIFLIITWIGVVYYMGLLGWWLWCTDVSKLKAEIEKELAKKKPNENKISQIRERIVTLEKENN